MSLQFFKTLTREKEEFVLNTTDSYINSEFIYINW